MNRIAAGGGSVVIVGGAASGGDPLPAPNGELLRRGFRFDTDFSSEGVRVSLDLGETATVNGMSYRVLQLPPLGEACSLATGALTPWGQVVSLSSDTELGLWVLLTDRHPAGVAYRPGAGFIVADPA